MRALKRSSAVVAVFALAVCAGAVHASEQPSGDAGPEATAIVGPDTTGAPPEVRAYYGELQKLGWIKGPTTVDVPGKSTLAVPEGYVFLDESSTTRFLEMNQNLAGGDEVMIAPRDLAWAAYLSFADEGYVEDDEQIDAAELLKALQQGAEAGNKERAQRGWAELHVVDWAVPPAYNPATSRLEWATLLESEGGRSVNFSTKVLSRRGHTSVILASAPEELAAARPQLDAVLGGYSFAEGERYADFVPGDKVATYGLAALVLGGAAAIASKKGLWAVLGAFIVSKAKILIAAVIGLVALLRKFVFGKKASDVV
jgi:uncharacterized membrane-anchored protein